MFQSCNWAIAYAYSMMHTQLCSRGVVCLNMEMRLEVQTRTREKKPCCGTPEEWCTGKNKKLEPLLFLAFQQSAYSQPKNKNNPPDL